MKIFRFIIIAISLIVIVVCGGSYLYLKSLVSDYEGTITHPDIKEGATVIRDEYGIPHISAEETWDLYFALGYCQAQDRLFQMDFYRRAARGELSEVLGEDLIDADVYLRTMGFLRTAKIQIEALDPDLLEVIEAFSAGVNAYVENNPLPVEFKILGYEPKPWTPEDSQAIGNLISFQLASWAYQNEMLNYLVLNKIGETAAKDLLPGLPDETVYIMAKAENPSFNVDSLSESSRAFLENFIKIERASNNWVVSGEKTTTGMPILCEDSHESGPELPTQWHLSHLVSGDMDVSGAMFPGAPIFIFGRNKNIAWGVTNFTLDTQDLFMEKINPENQNQVMYKGSWVDMELVTEMIKVKDGDSFIEKEVTIRITPHGPIINDAESDIGDVPMSLCAQGFEPWPLFEAFYDINNARNWDEFKSALSIYAAGPQHFVYADTDGNIGYVGAGKAPVRKKGDGTLPSPGWDGTCDWQGYYPFEMMPILFNPEKGYIATANNPPKKNLSPVIVSDYFESPWRALRIEEMLTEKEKLCVDDMKGMHLDVKSTFAERTVPIFISVLSERDGSDDTKAVVEELSHWDYVEDSDSAGAAIFEVMFQKILVNTFADELGEPVCNRFLQDKSVATNTLYSLILTDHKHPLFDDINTEEVEDFGDILEKSTDETIAFLNERLGKDPAQWSWGAIHEIEFSHIFGEVAFLRPIFNYGPFPFVGSDTTINRGGFNKAKPDIYKVDITASIRYIVDFSDLDNSLIVLSTGENGNILSRYREDMSDLFLRGEYARWYGNMEDIQSEGVATTTFLPAK